MKKKIWFLVLAVMVVVINGVAMNVYATDMGNVSDFLFDTDLVISSPTSQSAWNYLSVEEPVKQSNPADCKPFAVGDLDSGNLNLQVGLPAFSSGVDIYLAIQSNVIAGGALLLFDQSKNLLPVSTVLRKWKINNTAAINESLYGDIPISLLPAGVYNLYVLVAPTGEIDFSHYYFWSTFLSINSESKLVLYEKSSFTLFGGDDYDKINFPYFCKQPGCYKQSNVTVLGSSTYTHQTYKLVAQGKDFTITSITAVDLNGFTSAWFEGLEEGSIVKAGEEIEFSLVSTLSGGQQALLQWSFEVEDKGVQFVNTVFFQSN